MITGKLTTPLSLMHILCVSVKIQHSTSFTAMLHETILNNNKNRDIKGDIIV